MVESKTSLNIKPTEGEKEPVNVTPEKGNSATDTVTSLIGIDEFGTRKEYPNTPEGAEARKKAAAKYHEVLKDKYA